MSVKGSNFYERRFRLRDAWFYAVQHGDYARARLTRMAYYRLDDRIRSMREH